MDPVELRFLDIDNTSYRLLKLYILQYSPKLCSLNTIYTVNVSLHHLTLVRQRISI